MRAGEGSHTPDTGPPPWDGRGRPARMVAEMMVAADVVSVLVVDDQAPFRLAARAVLRRTEGFELVGEAADGDEALERARELRPALVLMDINMPRMNGIEATRQILAEAPGHHGVPLLDLPAQRPPPGGGGLRLRRRT